MNEYIKRETEIVNGSARRPLKAGGVFTANKHEIMPIPQGEIDNMNSDGNYSFNSESRLLIVNIYSLVLKEIGFALSPFLLLVYQSFYEKPDALIFGNFSCCLHFFL